MAFWGVINDSKFHSINMTGVIVMNSRAKPKLTLTYA